VRRVIDVGLLAAKHQRHVVLLAHRIVGRRLEDGPEVGAERARHLEVVLVAQQHVLVRRVDAREVPQQVADVGADAEVVELAGIDRNAHRSDYVSLWPLASCL
jgi:hypothetical protein